MRIASAVTVAAVLVGGLTACNSKSSSNNGDSANAAANAAQQNVDPKVALLATAAVMNKAGSAKLTMETAGADAPGTGSASWKTPQAMEITMKQQGQDTRVEIVDGVVYSAIPAAEAAKAGGKKWMKLDPKAAAAASAAKGGTSADDPAASFSATQQMLNPAVVIAANAQAGKLTKVGVEKVGTTDAVHIQSVAPVDALVNAMPGVGDALKKQITGSLKQDGTTATFDFWIDGKNELVQEKAKGVSAGSDGLVTIKYSDFGTPVTVQAPPAGEVIDLAQMMQLMKG